MGARSGATSTTPSESPIPVTSSGAIQTASATSQNPSQNESRLTNTTICVPIVYGSIAFALPKVQEYHTHQWTLYIRSPQSEDLSRGIAKVVFHLHPSFPQPVRELTAPPFEVTEKGWGEFEASIRIVWRDVGEKATVLTHLIKLYPPVDPKAPPKAVLDPSKVPPPVISEFYDEVVFTDPTPTFHRQLLSYSANDMPKVESLEPSVQKHLTTYSDESDFKTLLEAQAFLQKELESTKARIAVADDSRAALDEALSKVAGKAKVIASQTPPPISIPVSSTSGTGTKRKKSGGGSKKAKTS